MRATLWQKHCCSWDFRRSDYVSTHSGPIVAVDKSSGHYRSRLVSWNLLSLPLRFCYVESADKRSRSEPFAVLSSARSDHVNTCFLLSLSLHNWNKLYQYKKNHWIRIAIKRFVEISSDEDPQRNRWMGIEIIPNCVFNLEKCLHLVKINSIYEPLSWRIDSWQVNDSRIWKPLPPKSSSIPKTTYTSSIPSFISWKTKTPVIEWLV